jgi:hypothetical protein
MALARKKINRNYKELEIQEEKEYADYTLINIFINGFLLFDLTCSDYRRTRTIPSIVSVISALLGYGFG